MHPDFRSIQRFFQGLTEVCPIQKLNHLYLVHWPTDAPSPLDALLEAQFTGKVVVARASLADAMAHHYPEMTVILNDHPTNGEPADHILMELPQGKEASRLAIETALATLTPEGRLWIFGERESGIRSLHKRFSEVQTILFKGHLRLLALSPTSRMESKAENRAAFTPQADGFAYLNAANIQIAVKPGIFSWQAIDPATQLLLAAITTHPGQRILDWGCGSGILGAALAHRFVDLHVVMSDDLVTATQCARKTMEINGLQDRCEIVTEDGIGTQLAPMRFDAIITNPPFHRGVRTNHKTTLTFLASAATALNPGGTLWLVGNRFMNHGTLLKEYFTQVDEIDGDETFTVWRGLKAKTASAGKKGGPKQKTDRHTNDQWLSIEPGEVGMAALQKQMAEWSKKS